MRSDRPYRTGRSPDESLEEIALCSGSQFDPDVVAAFVEYMASDEGELASMGMFSAPFGVPAEARVGSSRTLAGAGTYRSVKGRQMVYIAKRLAP